MTARKSTAAALRRRMTPAQVVALYVTPSAADRCWPWVGPTNRWGYGRLNKWGREYMAHRLAYEQARGPIPPGFVVRHSCDNPPCCNPAHLSLGLPADNRMDCVTRERHTRGELVHCHVLTEADVLEMRTRAAAGETPTALAIEFGVTQSTASAAIRGRNWKHLPLAESA